MTDLILIDGHALAYRAFFGIKRPLRSPEGVPVNGLYGFGRALMAVVERCGAREGAVVFDSPGPSFRKRLYPPYKTNRPAPPEDFIPQLPLMMDLARCLGITVVTSLTFEADDLIAAAAVREAERGKGVVIVTPDKDLFQTLGEGAITILRPAGGDSFTRVDASSFRETFGFEPCHMAEYQALMGDRTDNIPGVAGVGPVTAGRLVRRFGDLESLYEGIRSVKGSLRDRLEKGREEAFLSRELARLRLDAPVPENLFLAEPDREGSACFCEEKGLEDLAWSCRSFSPCPAGW
ncbi:MAG TPA: 5'-3' exonuclease H3TH domain-containing protein [Synergistales bacterium]|nr:5'-3' exonuclease H3TH domain-containing protein [Synergistales bacterium]